MVTRILIAVTFLGLPQLGLWSYVRTIDNPRSHLHRWSWVAYICVFALGFLLWCGFYRFFGDPIWGATLEKHNYESEIYVLAFTEDEKVKNLRVPARVTSQSEFGSNRYYDISEIKIPGRGWIQLDGDDPIEPLHEDYVLRWDSGGRMWSLYFTDDLVRNETP